MIKVSHLKYPRLTADLYASLLDKKTR